MEALYDLPSGDRVRVIDRATVGQSLARILQLYREGATEPVFFGDQPRPEGVVISSDQWAEYETLKEDAETTTAENKSSGSGWRPPGRKDWVSFEDAAREGDLDLDLDLESDDDTNGGSTPGRA